MSELKPCPFCGGEMKMAIDGGFTKAYRAIHKDKCKYFNPNRETRLTQEEMINIWNARPVEDALTAENEALKAKVVELEADNARLFEEINKPENKKYRKTVVDIFNMFCTRRISEQLCVEIQHIVEKRLKTVSNDK